LNGGGASRVRRVPRDLAIVATIVIPAEAGIQCLCFVALVAD
jgi:hypothetical protein